MPGASASAVAPLSQSEASAALAAAGAALEARAAQIRAEIAKNRATLERLKDEYRGRSGRYKGPDARARATALEGLKYNNDGKTLAEGREAARREAREIARGSRLSSIRATWRTTPPPLTDGSAMALPLLQPPSLQAKVVALLLLRGRRRRRTATRTTSCRRAWTRTTSAHRRCSGSSTPGR